MKKIHSCLLCFAAVAVTLHGTTIGIYCIQNKEVPPQAAELTAMLETELFERCFNTGYIAVGIKCAENGYDYYEKTNLSARHLDSSIDYLAEIYCEYGQNISKPTADTNTAHLRHVRWKLTDFSSHTVLYNKTIAMNTLSATDTAYQMKTIGEKIANSLLKIIANTAADKNF